MAVVTSNTTSNAMLSHQIKRRKRIQKVILVTLEILLAIVVLIPFAWMFSVSIKPNEEPFSIPPRLWPNSPTLQNYQTALYPEFIRYFINSVIVSILTIIISISTGLLAAYGFGRLQFPGRRLLLIGIVLAQ